MQNSLRLKKFFSRFRLRLYLLVISLTGMAFGVMLLLGLDAPVQRALDNLPAGQARVTIYRPPAGIVQTFTSSERSAAALFKQAGVQLVPGETLRWNGLPLGLEQRLPPAPSYMLQIQPAVALTITENNQTRTVQSSAPNLLQALWQNGVRLSASDSVSAGTIGSVLRPLDQPLSVNIQRARALRIQRDGQELTVYSGAPTVGLALAETGYALQALDYSIPGEDQPVPNEGVIQIFNVREEVRIDQKVLPFEMERRADPAAELGKNVVLESGQNGLEMTRTRTRFENGREISRQTDARWMLAQPKKQIEVFGTKIVASSLQTEVGTLEYWRAIEMYATSYYPCGFKSGCNDRTASGQTLRKGIVAVSTEWYQALAGYRVYVPGYGMGTIADAGGGIAGKKWIDLGYGNNDYVGWSKNVTVYFLNPPPPTIPWFLQ